jgi:TonB family protein
MKSMTRSFIAPLYKSVLSLTLLLFTALHSTAQEPGIPKGTACCGQRNLSTLRDLATKIVEPSYPEEAKKQAIEDHVVVELVINEKGKVLKARVVYGHQVLREAALEAARQWEFTPAKYKGKAVKVVGTITFYFPPQKEASKAVSKGYDFLHDGLHYQVKANRPSGKPGSPVTLVAKAKNYEWDCLVRCGVFALSRG